KRVDIPSYRVKVGDTISLREKSKKSKKFEQIAEVAGGRLTPMWLDVDKEKQSAKVTRQFQRDDLDYEIAEHLIIELYSK
ncbi:MAG: 30S ribosomal protein S4, partial [Oscillospiraceae bacterium]|nr:30S ribosomal protein S4 [Oscillospiraceae bacterium]